MKILCLKLKGKWAFNQCAINKYFIFNWNFSWEAKGTSCTSSLKGHTVWPATREYLRNIVIRARYPSEWMMVSYSLIQWFSTFFRLRHLLARYFVCDTQNLAHTKNKTLIDLQWKQHNVITLIQAAQPVGRQFQILIILNDKIPIPFRQLHI